ncbi:MAG: NUDIX domain-containing protein [Myxococcales bacterium]|nr:NUDIX domain-containing protein [Myxococcales bacterium]
MKVSAGILLFRRPARIDVGASHDVLLVFPGGPYWSRRDAGAWTLPKGQVEPGEGLLEAARREFQEETGWAVPDGLQELGSVRMKSGKVVHAWAGESDVDASSLVSNTFDLEWPRHSGRIQTVPEVDRAEWFAPSMARIKLNTSLVPLLDRLAGLVG